MCVVVGRRGGGDAKEMGNAKEKKKKKEWGVSPGKRRGLGWG